MEYFRNLHERPWVIMIAILVIIFVTNFAQWLLSEDEDDTRESAEISDQTAVDTPEKAVPPVAAEKDAPDHSTPAKTVEPSLDAKPEAPLAANAEASVKGPSMKGAQALTFPVDCLQGDDCWIARYMDRGPDRRRADYMCEKATQDKHKGTDIAVADMAAMERGVRVLAAASGTVLRSRDGVADISARERDKDAIDGKECGNALVIDHGDGLETQYCHLKQNSLFVRNGDSVEAGDPIGLIGLSGQTEYPHLHFMVRKNGVDIDPYDGGVFEESCKTKGAGSLWAKPQQYEPMTQLPVFFTSEPPARSDVWNGGQDALPATSPSLALTGRAFHVSEADKWYFTITAPDGSVAVENRFMINQDKQFYYRHVGLKAPAEGFMPGIWKGEIRIVREEGGAPYIQRTEVRIEG